MNVVPRAKISLKPLSKIRGPLMLKLNLGCGQAYLSGWINIDIDSDKADLKHDLRNGLPYEDNTADYIFNEHFI